MNRKHLIITVALVIIAIAFVIGVLSNAYGTSRIVNGDTAVGMKTEIITTQQNRPLQVVYWYPTTQSSQYSTTFENAAFYGINVHKNARPDTKKRPLVVLSHGYMGHYGNQSWLAKRLVARGYIVAAPNHPGTTHRNRDSRAAAELWRRPRDISSVIDRVLANPEIAGTVDAQNIYAVGHSLGVWTVIALAGGQFSHQKMLDECAVQASLAGCEVYSSLALTPDDKMRNFHMQADPRVKAVVALDIGAARGFTQESLAHITLPTLLIAAGEPNHRIPKDLETQYLVDNLHASTVETLTGAMHFSFLQRCKPNAIALLEEESTGDGIICKDAENYKRQDLHDITAQLIIKFLDNVASQVNSKANGTIH